LAAAQGLCETAGFEHFEKEKRSDRMCDGTFAKIKTLTANHICHRTRIPFGHVLIERRCVSKHCKRGCKKEKKVPKKNQQKRQREN